MTQPVSGLRPGLRSCGARARALALSLAYALSLTLAATAWGAVPTAPAHAHARHSAAVVVHPAAEKRAAKAHAVGRRSAPRVAVTRVAVRHVSGTHGHESAKTRSSLKKTVAGRRAATSARRRLVAAAAADAPTPALKRAAAAVVPAKGGELTADEFFQVAAASSEARVNAPLNAQVDAPEASASAGAVQPLAKASGEADVSARIAALTHPSHGEMAEELSVPVMLPGLYKNGRLVVPAPLKGSREILVHQNQMADDEGLERVRNDAALKKLRAGHQLVDFPETASLRVNPELGAQRRCARVWTVRFTEDMAKSYYARFHEPLQVSSAVRTVAYQLRLRRTNGNAAGVGGEAASPHLTGQAVDFGKSGMSIEEIAWMRAYLKPLMDAGKVDVEEEFQQACFHISVYKSYLPTQKRVVAEVAQVRRPVVVESVGR